MSRRLLLATSGHQAVEVPDPLDPEPEAPWEPPPYYAGTVPSVPTAAPWHRSQPCVIPTYDGYNQTLHPTVVDFGGKWNGYRWWMVHTPYPVGIGGVTADDNENPSVVVSNDCVNWTPIGAQPFIAKPESGYNSDPELLWNPDQARFEFWWRPVSGGYKLRHMHSVDGITWSAPVDAIVPYGNFVSPGIIRFSTNDYRMWSPDASTSDNPTPPTFRLYRSQATSPEGPWSTHVVTTSNGLDASLLCWHGGMARLGTTNTVYAVAQMNATNAIHAGTSTDGGISWTWDDDPILAPVSGTWTATGIYRPYPVLHENGTHMRIWYSGRSDMLGWRIGYAEVPLSLWPTV